MKPRISIIAGIQRKKNGLGYKNELLYRISDDLKRLKALTTGHPIIMGRKTFDSIGRPLPHRTNIVITRNTTWNHEDVIVVSSLEEALLKAKEVEQEEIFIFGGGEIYTQALPHVDRLYLTVVNGEKEADVFFPDWSAFTKVVEQQQLTDEKSGIPYEYNILER